MSNDKSSGRRDFFRALGRVAAGGALAGGVGYLAARSGSACLREFKCEGCSELRACGEPQALMTRTQLQRDGQARPPKETSNGNA